MTEFEKKRKEFAQKVKDNLEKISELASGENAIGLLNEVIRGGIEKEEDLDVADSIVQLLIDMVDVCNDVQNNEISSSGFYKNKGIKLAIKYINAEKEGNVDSVMAELESYSPEESAEAVYGIMTSASYLDIAEVFIRLKTGYEYDEEDDSKNREEYNDRFERAYLTIMNSIETVYKSGIDNAVTFAKKFHALYGMDKLSRSLVDFFGSLIKEIDKHKEQMDFAGTKSFAEELDKAKDEYEYEDKDKDYLDALDDEDDEEEDEEEDDLEDLENNSSVIYIPSNFTPVREKWEELGFIFGYMKNGKYPVMLPAGWSLNEKNEFIDENGNKRGFIDKEEKLEAQLTRRYDVHVVENEVYFGNEEEKLYRIDLASPTPERLRLARAVIRQWAYENYPDWEDYNAYRNKKDEETKK